MKTTGTKNHLYQKYFLGTAVVWSKNFKNRPINLATQRSTWML